MTPSGARPMILSREFIVRADVVGAMSALPAATALNLTNTKVDFASLREHVVATCAVVPPTVNARAALTRLGRSHGSM